MIALALGSCSNDPVGPQTPEEEANGREVIKLGLSSSRADVQVGTRGAGTVGSEDDATNKWCYEDLYVLMTTTNSKGLEKNVDDSEQKWGFTSFKGENLKEQFDGTFISRPSEEAATSAIDYKHGKNKADKYYPIDKNVASNFFAFHIDDAAYDFTAGAALTEPAIVKNTEETEMTVDFKIDGSQDLMVGMADNGGDGYSCATSRAGVVPEIVMNHLLTRLTFMVKNGNTLVPANCDGVKVNAIRVKSKTDGKLLVAYNPAEGEENPTEFITWTTSTDNTNENYKEDAEGNGYIYAPLTLQRASKETETGYVATPSLTDGKSKLAPFAADEPVYTMTTDLKPVSVGDALLVNPGDVTYEMEVDLAYTVEYMNEGTLVTGAEEKVTLGLDLNLQDGAAFAAGSSYNVVITVYGLEKIAANVTLSKWADGGNIGVGGDDDPTWPSNEDLGL